MRINLLLSPSKGKVPSAHQEQLVGAVHKWLGNSALQGGASFYSYSGLQGGTESKSGLLFPEGARWSINAHSVLSIRSIIDNIHDDPKFAWGMRVLEFALQEAPFFEGRAHFKASSPILARSEEGGRTQYYSYQQAEADGLLTQALQHKLCLAGLPDAGVSVSFDRSDKEAKEKAVLYGGISHKGSLCDIVVEGTQEQVAFAWNVGLGSHTELGFGGVV